MALVGRVHFDNLPIVKIIPGQYYHSDMVNAGSGTASTLAGRMYFQRLWFPGQTIDRMAIEVTTGDAGNARLGLYLDNGSGIPGALLLDAGTVDTTSIALVEASFTAINLPATMVWTAALFEAAPECRCGTATNTGRNGVSSLSAGIRGWIATQSYGALPSTAPAFNDAAGATNIPLIAIKKS